jgi:DNA-binding transcriptional LysR family regulator
VQWDERIGRRLKLRDINILAAVVELGTMAKAAERLAVSQPVISKAVADLEHMLGVPLLDRGRQGVEPTAYGEALLRRSSAAFDELKQAVLEIESLTDPTKGEVSIGATMQLIDSLIPKVIAGVQQKYPRIRVNVAQYPSGTSMYKNLRERKIDFIVTRTGIPTVDQDMGVLPLFDEILYVVVGRQNRRLTRSGLDLCDLINEPWLLPPPGGAPGIVIAEMFRVRGLKLPDAAVITSSIGVMQTLLRTGPYIAFIPRSVLDLGAKQTSLRVLWRQQTPGEPVGIVSLKGRTMSPAARTFVDHMRTVTTQAFGENC